MMKRIWALGLALLLLFTTVACSGSEKTNGVEEQTKVTVQENTNGKESSTPSTLISETETASQTETEATETASSNDAETPTLESDKWSSFYAYYTERFNKGYEHMEDLSEDLGATMIFMDLIAGEIDLAFTATFFDKDATTALGIAFSMFGYEDVKYQESGDTAGVTMKDKEGKEVVQTLRYDGNNSAEFTSTTDGTLEFSLSIAVTDDYVAKTYTKGDLSYGMHAVIYENGDLSIGVNDSATDALSLYKNTDAAKDSNFISKMEKQLVIENGKVVKKP